MSSIVDFAKREAILLDLDGTLYTKERFPEVFTEMEEATGERVRNAYAAPSSALAYAALLDDKRRLGCHSKSETLEKVHGITLAEMNRWREARTFPERYLSEDGRLRATIQHLARHFRLVLGTNNAPGLARRILDALRVPKEIFEHILTSEDVGHAKPEAAFFLRVLELTRLPAQAFVSVGDSEASDLVPAQKLGMGIYLVATIEDFYRLAEVDRSAS